MANILNTVRSDQQAEEFKRFGLDVLKRFDNEKREAEERSLSMVGSLVWRVLHGV